MINEQRKCSFFESGQKCQVEFPFGYLYYLEFKSRKNKLLIPFDSQGIYVINNVTIIENERGYFFLLEMA